eukprot:6462038-Amphidinium_carterae.3
MEACPTDRANLVRHLVICQVIMDGGFLLSLLKMNPPSAKKYTREVQLPCNDHVLWSPMVGVMPIRSCSPSKTSPLPSSQLMLMGASSIATRQQENFTSPLVLKGKFDLEEESSIISCVQRCCHPRTQTHTTGWSCCKPPRLSKGATTTSKRAGTRGCNIERSG